MFDRASTIQIGFDIHSKRDRAHDAIMYVNISDPTRHLTPYRDASPYSWGRTSHVTVAHNDPIASAAQAPAILITPRLD